MDRAEEIDGGALLHLPQGGVHICGGRGCTCARQGVVAWAAAAGVQAGRQQAGKGGQCGEGSIAWRGYNQVVSRSIGHFDEFSIVPCPEIDFRRDCNSCLQSWRTGGAFSLP
jgi:hypothetical protein